jgi:ABC-2 type transport system ATP-binding protein
MISIRRLVKRFGDRRAVDDVSFEVNQGDVLGFLGPNGAGKSTTMRMITGFIPPTSGTAIVNGQDVVLDPVAVKRRVGYLPENAPAYGDMTVAEFLGFCAQVRGYEGDTLRRRVDRTIDRCFLHSVRNQTFETLSKGYRQRTCFAQSILHDPPILIMDEPTDGLDPNQKHVVRSMIQEMAAEKVIIFSTHLLEEVDAVCNRVIIISQGRLIVDSTPAELRKRSRSFNAVQVAVAAPPDQVRSTFRALPGVASVDLLSNGSDECVCRVYPRDSQSIASRLMEAAHQQNWTVTELETDRGRLDEVFRDLTTTDDVSREAQTKD